MAIKPKGNGKYLVDIRDVFGNRIERTYNSKTEAKAFEASIIKAKYENKLITNGLQKKRFLIQDELIDFQATKMDLRPSSIKKYRFVIKQLTSFCSAMSINFLDEFTPDHSTVLFNELVKEREYIKGSSIQKIKPKPKTINYFLATTKAFFNYLLVKGHIKRNPMLHIKKLRVEKKQPEYYTVQELKALFQQPLPIAYYYTFMGLLFTGMRFSELANLHWGDVDFMKQLVFVRSKENFKTKTDNGERAIPMNVVLYKMLLKMWKNKMSEKYVFTSRQGSRLRERRTLEILKKYAEMAGIKSRVYLHKFRHTYATMLIQRGVPIQNIKELLGHWSVIETEIYAHNKSEYLHPDVAHLDHLLE